MTGEVASNVFTKDLATFLLHLLPSIRDSRHPTVVAVDHVTVDRPCTCSRFIFFPPEILSCDSANARVSFFFSGCIYR